MKKRIWYCDLLVMLAALCVAGVAVVWVQCITGRIDGVAMLIQQVLMNLLENAVLHAEGMTTLTLRVFTLGSRAVFEVKDDGCGIPKERLRTLFSGTGSPDPNAPADSGKHGMGIGLSVCAAIIKAHGGEIDAESRPGEGTTIRFWLETEKIELEDAEDEQ